MSIDPDKLLETLTYKATAPSSEICQDLHDISKLDRVVEKKQAFWNQVRNIGFVGVFLWFFVAFLFSGAFLAVFMILWLVFLGLAIVGLIQGHNYHKKNIPNHRYRLAENFIDLLDRDRDKSQPLSIRLILSQPLDDSKKISTDPHPTRRGWKVESFEDNWLVLQGAFVDGTEFFISSTENFQRKSGTKRSRSGKTKFKSKTKYKGEQMELSLNFPKKRYGGIKILQYDAKGAVQLPKNARVKRLKVADNKMQLTVKLKPASEESIYQTVTMMLMSLYQVLNLAQKLTKKTTA